MKKGQTNTKKNAAPLILDTYAARRLNVQLRRCELPTGNFTPDKYLEIGIACLKSALLKGKADYCPMCDQKIQGGSIDELLDRAGYALCAAFFPTLLLDAVAEDCEEKDKKLTAWAQAAIAEINAAFH